MILMKMKEGGGGGNLTPKPMKWKRKPGLSFRCITSLPPRRNRGSEPPTRACAECHGGRGIVVGRRVPRSWADIAQRGSLFNHSDQIKAS